MGASCSSAKKVEKSRTLSKDLEKIYILSAQDPRPPLNLTRPRLYHHHNCPFCEKVRIALAAKNIVYQSVEVDTRNKPQWHVDLGGTVPILELPEGRVFTDSKQIMDYAQETYPHQGYSLLPSEPEKVELLRSSIPLADKLQRGWMPIQARKEYDEVEFKTMKDSMQEVEDFIVKNGNTQSPFILGGPNPSLLDIHVYVVIIRLQYLKDSVFDKLWIHFEWERFPRLVKLVESMRVRPELQNAITQKRPMQYHWEKFALLKPGERQPLFLPLVYQ